MKLYPKKSYRNLFFFFCCIHGYVHSVYFLFYNLKKAIKSDGMILSDWFPRIKVGTHR